MLMMKTALSDMRTYECDVSTLKACTEKEFTEAQHTSNVMRPWCATENKEVVQGSHHVIGLVQHESMPALDMVRRDMECDHGKDKLSHDDMCSCNHGDAPDGVDRATTV